VNGSFTYTIGHLGLSATVGLSDSQGASTLYTDALGVSSVDNVNGVSIQGMLAARYNF
jgi:hypothetical protein